MATGEEKAKQLEEQVKTLQDELKLASEAKTLGESCKSLTDFTQAGEEPFAASHPEPNEWHKSAGGGGGCIIL